MLCLSLRPAFVLFLTIMASCSGVGPNSSTPQAAEGATDAFLAAAEAYHAAEATATAHLSLPAYYQHLLAHASDAPVTIAGIEVHGIRSYLLKNESAFSELAATYGSFGAAKAALGLHASAGFAPATIRAQLAALLTSFAHGTGPFAAAAPHAPVKPASLALDTPAPAATVPADTGSQEVTIISGVGQVHKLNALSRRKMLFLPPYEPLPPDLPAPGDPADLPADDYWLNN